MANIVFALLLFYNSGKSHDEHVWMAPSQQRGSYEDCMANAAETLRHNQLDLIKILCVPMPF